MADNCVRSGFTLVELMIVVVVVGVLAALTLPNFGATFEIAKGREAEATLRMIYEAELAYYLSSPSPRRYGHYNNPVTTPPNPQDLSPYIPVGSISSVEWSYSVPGGGATSFTATATRNRGYRAGKIRTINELGQLRDGQSTPPLPDGWSP